MRADFVRTTWAALLAVVALSALATGCQRTPRRAAFTRVQPRFYLEVADAPRFVVLPVSGVQIATSDRPVLSEGDIIDVKLAEVELGRCLVFELTPAAARDFYRLSAANQGRRLVLLVDGVPIGARRLDGPVNDGRLFIFLEVPDENLSKLAHDLRESAVDVQRALTQSG